MTLGGIDDAIDALSRDAVVATHPARAEATEGGPHYRNVCSKRPASLAEVVRTRVRPSLITKSAVS